MADNMETEGEHFGFRGVFEGDEEQGLDERMETEVYEGTNIWIEVFNRNDDLPVELGVHDVRHITMYALDRDMDRDSTYSPVENTPPAQHPVDPIPDGPAPPAPDDVIHAVLQHMGLPGLPGHNPIAVDPNAIHPNAIDPNAIDPNAVDPNAVDPNAIDPNAIDPNAIDPNAVDPNAVDPNAIDPNAIDPNAVDPNAVDPNAVDPNAVDPNAVDPNAINVSPPPGSPPPGYQPPSVPAYDPNNNDRQFPGPRPGEYLPAGHPVRDERQLVIDAAADLLNVDGWPRLDLGRLVREEMIRLHGIAHNAEIQERIRQGQATADDQAALDQQRQLQLRADQLEGEMEVAEGQVEQAQLDDINELQDLVTRAEAWINMMRGQVHRLQQMVINRPPARAQPGDGSGSESGSGSGSGSNGDPDMDRQQARRQLQQLMNQVDDWIETWRRQATALVAIINADEDVQMIDGEDARAQLRQLWEQWGGRVPNIREAVRRMRTRLALIVEGDELADAETQRAARAQANRDEDMDGQ